METISQWKKLGAKALNTISDNISDIVPSILGVIFIFILGWLLVKIVLSVLKKLLKISKIEKLSNLINEKNIFDSPTIKIDLTKIILGFAKWVLYLVILIVASDVMGWTFISEEIGNLLRYLPKLFSALALFLVGVYIASFIKKAIFGFLQSFDLGGANLISNLIFYLIVVFVSLTALMQAGINIEIITDNLTIILGAFLGAMAIGLGFGSKEIVGDLLKAFFTRKNYEVGQHISYKDISGVIESVNNITMTLVTDEGKVIVPIRDVIDNNVTVRS